MGSITSGRFGGRSTRPRETDLRRVTVRDLLSNQPPEEIVGARELRCTVSSTDVATIALRFTPTRQPLGGARWWVHCPRCGARRGVLYFQPGPAPAAVLQCAPCHGVLYHSQRVSTAERWRLRARKLYDRAGTTAQADVHIRPRGMHESNFERLLDRARQYEDAAYALEVAAILSRPMPKKPAPATRPLD